ncbi:glycerophosphodiester phosphodiesterase [Idiomarina sp.]|uniref:glycerophosphodiester phosphodiesterase n=1 Tax=Idiomarina sp. TaxID=1874361 RepID=UPI002EB4EF14|nr:glycerophosphodiester phosphodiesterase [Pseudomonadota bacterium]
MKWISVVAGIAWFSSLSVSAQADNSTEELAVTPIKLPEFIDIAHRGASGYLPEHSQAATVMAYALGADYIEQDVQLSRDGKAVVLHDAQLDAVTNVAEVFPERHRPDGSYYAVDFTLNHLKQLRLTPRRNSDGSARYPQRFQNNQVEFKIQTLAESLNLIQELNRVRNKNTGVYIEVKASRWYRDQDYDPLAVVMNVLSKNGYSDQQQATPLYLQSFDPETLRRVKREFHCDFPLVQLIADNSWGETPIDYDALRTYAGLESLTSYVDHVGLWLGHVLKEVKDGQPVWSDVLENAEKVGLKVHVYTLRADQLPQGVESLKQLRGWLKEAGVQGVFSDFPDQK